MNRINEYIQYHVDSSRALDIDPQVEALQYICKRFDLDIEQRCWLCFLFSTNYCVATTYYMFNQFPRFEDVDIRVLQVWWEKNRDKLIFQTDRAWVRSKNQFVEAFISYQNFVFRWSQGSMRQHVAITRAISPGIDPYARYDYLLKNFRIALFGRFTMFLYSELLHVIAGIDIAVRLDLREAESSRNGLVFALGLEDVAYTGRHGRKATKAEIEYLNKGLAFISGQINRLPINPRHKSLWSIETTLCAYKKNKLGKLIREAANLGASAMSTEFFCVEQRSPTLKSFMPTFNELCGFDVMEFYRKYSVSSGYLRLNRKVKEPFLRNMKNLCEEVGMRFYVSDAHFKEMCCNGSCCGLPPDWNYSRGKWSEALQIAKINGVVRYSDVKGDIEKLVSGFQWIRAQGFNCNSSERRAKFEGMTMADYMRWLWNNPQAGQSPYKLFEGVLRPVGKDDCKDLIYQYTGKD